MRCTTIVAAVSLERDKVVLRRRGAIEPLVLCLFLGRRIEILVLGGWFIRMDDIVGDVGGG